MTIEHVTTSGDYGFKANLKLKKSESIAKYLRAVANEGRDSPITMDDATLLQVVESVELKADETRDDIEVLRVEAIEAAEARLSTGDAEVSEEETTEEEVEGEATPEGVATDAETGKDVPLPAAVKLESIDAEAAEFIKPAAASAEFNKELDDDIAAGDKVKQAPLNMMLQARKVWGKLLDGAPVPGMKAGDPSLGNRLPDKRRTVTKKKNGGFTDKWVSIYDKMFDYLPRGKAIAAEKKLIEESETKANKYTGQQTRRENDLKTLNSQRTNGITLLKQGIALHLQLLEVGMLPGVTVEYLKEKDGKPRNTRFPIWVRDPSDPENSETLAVTSFLALDPAKARDPENVTKKGGVFKALITSGARGTRDDEGGGKNKLPPIDSVDLAEEAVASFVTFLENRVNRTAILKRLNEKDSDAFRRSMVELHTETKPYYDKYVAWYRKTEEAASAQEATRLEAAQQRTG